MTRAQDAAARIGLLILGIGLAAVAFAVGAATTGWNGAARTLILSVIAAAAAGSVITGTDIRTPYAQRTPLRWRRHGEASETTVVPPPVGTGPAHPVRIALDPKNSLIAGAIFLVAAITAWPLASRLDFSDDGAVVTILALATAPWMTYLAARSALRILLAARAVEITGEALLLGPALGYWPRLELTRDSVVVISLPEADQGDVRIVLADRTYRINPRHMVDPATVAEQMRTAWPERTDTADSEVLVFEGLEVAQQQAMTAPGAVVELAQRTIARRRVLGTVILISGFALVAVGTASYVNRRIANDRLLTEGRPVAATIIDVDRSSRGPDTMTVEYVFGGESFTSDIHSRWFEGFRGSAVGRSVRILVDPQDPTLVRLPGTRNISPWIWLVLMGSIVTAFVAFLYFRQQQQFAALLRNGRWGRRAVLLDKPGRYWRALVPAESKSTDEEIWVDAGRVGSARGVEIGKWATWSCENEESMLLVIDEINRVVTVPRLESPGPQDDADG